VIRHEDTAAVPRDAAAVSGSGWKVATTSRTSGTWPDWADPGGGCRSARGLSDWSRRRANSV